MKTTNLMAMALDPSLILKTRGFDPDPWQRDVLLAQERDILLNCCRQAGKSTVTSALAPHTALFKPKSDVLLLSPGQRQSQEIFRKVLNAYNALGRPVRRTYETQLRMELENGSERARQPRSRPRPALCPSLLLSSPLTGLQGACLGRAVSALL